MKFEVDTIDLLEFQCINHTFSTLGVDDYLNDNNFGQLCQCYSGFHINFGNILFFRHSNERPHACEWCGKGFLLAHKLAEHRRRVHTGEKPFKCNMCDQRFTDSRYVLFIQIVIPS